MNSITFETFGIFCFSVAFFGLGTAVAGEILSFGDDDSVFFMAWLTGIIIFGITMAITY